MGRSKIGNVYSFYTEILMLEKANDLEKQGYKVERGRGEIGTFTVKIIGCR